MRGGASRGPRDRGACFDNHFNRSHTSTIPTAPCTAVADTDAAHGWALLQTSDIEIDSGAAEEDLCEGMHRPAAEEAEDLYDAAVANQSFPDPYVDAAVADQSFLTSRQMMLA